MLLRNPWLICPVLLLVSPGMLLAHNPTVSIDNIQPEPARVGEQVTFTGAFQHQGDHQITSATYEWNFGDGQTAGPAMGPTTTHGYAGPGSFDVVCTVRVYQMGQLHGQGCATRTARVFGGPIVGEGDIRQYDSAPPPWTQLSATSPTAQPTGTTYAWAVESAIGETVRAEVVPGYETTAITNVRARPMPEGVSSQRDDTRIRLTYALANRTDERMLPATVRRPTTLPLGAPQGPTQGGPTIIYYDGDPVNPPNWYGFSGQFRRYRLFDQFGPPNGWMAGVSVNEVWDNIVSNRPSYWTGPTPGPGWPTDGLGYTPPDNFFQSGYRPPGLDLNRPAFELMGRARQRFWAGSATATLGCLVATYDPTTWNTNGVVFP